MATTTRTNGYHVDGPRPKGGSVGKSKGNSNVAVKRTVVVASSGTMASVPKVSLGTTHGNHNVAHPVKGN